MTTEPFKPASLDSLYAAEAPEPATAPAAEVASQDTGAQPAAAAPPPTEGKGAAEPVKTEGAPPAPKTEAKPEGDWVPRKALEDERRKRQKMEEDLRKQVQNPGKQQETKPATPDPLIDPEAFAQHIRNEEFKERVEDSIAGMIEEVGEDEFRVKEAAFKEAAAKDPSLGQRLRRSRDPAKFAYTQGKKALEDQVKTSGDTDAEAYERFKTRLAQDFDLVPKASPQGQPQAQQPAPSQAQRRPSIPTSLAGVQSAGARTAGAGAPARRSLDQLLNE